MPSLHDEALVEGPPAGPSSAVEALLPSLPNPEGAVHFLSKLRSEAPEAADRILGDRSALRLALTVFSYSRFLSDAIIRYPEWLTEIVASKDLRRGFLREEYEDQLTASLGGTPVPRAIDLALFRRRKILRIMLRDVLGYAGLSETTEDLSNLADAILNVTWQSIRKSLGISEAFSVIALGKLGGAELNYSSDIDLMFVYAGSKSDATLLSRAAQLLTHTLSSYTPEGRCYRVDLRLRPDGRFGEVCQPLDGVTNYYATRGRDWELQMLIKARLAAGDPGPCRDLMAFVEPLIYRTTTDFSTIEAVSETRARIHEREAGRTSQTGLNVKLAKGGIRDVEFLVQCLQRLHGGREPWVRHGGTLRALSRLRDKDLLSASEYARLASAYQFLRHLEHRLQFDEDRQTHTLPRDAQELDLLARRMPPGSPALPCASGLERELDRHLADVQDLYDRVINSHRPIAPGEAQSPASAESETFPPANLARYLERAAPSLIRLIRGSNMARNQGLESFLDKVAASPALLGSLEENGELARCTIDLFEHSRYFADQLVRTPELLREIEQACADRQGRTGFVVPDDPLELRRFFAEQMVRIQSDSVYHRVPVFLTLKRTSDLAEAVIAAAYRIALRETLEIAPPAGPGYAPSDQMLVIALGRLGVREFDLASDADLIFVIPDSDAAEALFWTHVAERIIGVVGAYTGEGVVFTIDTRLRPNGREGALVQTESAYRDYFARRAEAWEGISYMKARAVAGNIERGTAFLNEIQEIDWRRYGQNGRSKAELAHMRARLEKEQGTRNPLKAGPGGYYDIDFVLMYLRLRGAGMFFKVLNTPARIEVVEKMGHLDREDVSCLTNAANLYRAIDHGLRVSTGHAEGRLPKSRARLAVLTELVRRWTPRGIVDGGLENATRLTRQETRALFHRIFGPA